MVAQRRLRLDAPAHGQGPRRGVEGHAQRGLEPSRVPGAGHAEAVRFERRETRRLGRRRDAYRRESRRRGWRTGTKHPRLRLERRRRTRRRDSRRVVVRGGAGFVARARRLGKRRRRRNRKATGAPLFVGDVLAIQRSEPRRDGRGGGTIRRARGESRLPGRAVQRERLEALQARQRRDRVARRERVPRQETPPQRPRHRVVTDFGYQIPAQVQLVRVPQNAQVSGVAQRVPGEVEHAQRFGGGAEDLRAIRADGVDFVIARVEDVEFRQRRERSAQPSQFVLAHQQHAQVRTRLDALQALQRVLGEVEEHEILDALQARHARDAVPLVVEQAQTVLALEQAALAQTHAVQVQPLGVRLARLARAEHHGRAGLDAALREAHAFVAGVAGSERCRFQRRRLVDGRVRVRRPRVAPGNRQREHGLADGAYRRGLVVRGRLARVRGGGRARGRDLRGGLEKCIHGRQSHGGPPAERRAFPVPLAGEEIPARHRPVGPIACLAALAETRHRAPPWGAFECRRDRNHDQFA